MPIDRMTVCVSLTAVGITIFATASRPALRPTEWHISQGVKWSEREAIHSPSSSDSNDEWCFSLSAQEIFMTRRLRTEKYTPANLTNAVGIKVHVHEFDKGTVILLCNVYTPLWSSGQSS